MFATRSREDEITAAVEIILSGENIEFRRRLILLLSRLNVDQWELLQQYAWELVEGLPLPDTEKGSPKEPAIPREKDWDDLTKEEKLALNASQLDEEEKNRGQNPEPPFSASAG